jgi:hypothetical protein
MEKGTFFKPCATINPEVPVSDQLSEEHFQVRKLTCSNDERV